MRLFLFIAVPVFILGTILLWAFAHRATPFYVRVTGLDVRVMEFTDGRYVGMPMAVVLSGSRDSHLIRSINRGAYILAFGLPDQLGKEYDFTVGLGYVGAYRRRLDLDFSPAVIKDAWHIRLTADGTTTLFERDVAFDDAAGDHPCLIRF